ncbi:MAG: hypothetical protein OEZ32_10450 [Nitrospinota bacterium]|nr:hypothetical protein [Nitrospinota bacterium]
MAPGNSMPSRWLTAVVALLLASPWAAMADDNPGQNALKYNVRGASASSRDNHPRALRLHEMALKARLAADDISGAIMELHNISVDHLRMNNLDASQSSLSNAMELYEEEARMGMGREKEKAMQEAMAHVTTLKAIILLDNGSHEEAGKWAERAMVYCQKSGCIDKGRIMNVRGRVALAADAHDTAETLANGAMAENRKNKNQVETANSIRLLAETAEARGEREKANEQYQKALVIDREEKLGNKIAMDLLGLARGYAAMKDIESAELFAKRALIVSNAADYPTGARSASELLEKLRQ